MENFAVKSESFALYEAFKKDCEAIGWVYNYNFTPFCKEQAVYNGCLYFSDRWNGKDTPLSFSFSNGGNIKSFSLETQYGEALAFAKKVWADEHKFKFGLSGTCSLSSSGTLDVSAMNMCPLVTDFYKLPVMPTLKFNVGDYLTMTAINGNVFYGILSGNTKIGNGGFPYYAGFYGSVVDFDSAFGLWIGDDIELSTPAEIALLDTKLAEKGKRFDKEKCELVDIPKYKEPIIGEMAIFWDNNKSMAFCAVLIDKDNFRYHDNTSIWKNAILFESPEQYKAFLKS